MFILRCISVDAKAVVAVDEHTMSRQEGRNGDMTGDDDSTDDPLSNRQTRTDALFN